MCPHFYSILGIDCFCKFKLIKSTKALSNWEIKSLKQWHTWYKNSYFEIIEFELSSNRIRVHCLGRMAVLHFETSLLFRGAIWEYVHCVIYFLFRWLCSRFISFDLNRKWILQLLNRCCSITRKCWGFTSKL